MSESRVAKATIRDEGLLAALEEAEEEHGSLADALRHAVATTYAGDDDVETVYDSGLPVKAEEGHRKLVEWTGVGGRIELGTAESILANHLNIQKEAVRKVVIQPLKREDVIALHQGIHHVSIVVGKNDDEPTETESPVEPSASKEAVADGGEARERLDELAAAGMEVADGDE
ncbi:hypothetical protein SAMN04488066_101367 [Halorubrum aquaticum]|uniref:Uncharacterized protein n=1 Tax=Halorubrum aquaticum TaxID=387340 RepID=A0A1I2ZAC2_9EURY|nr:hypothetical protein [Halorubrum aquaticum]SFH34456.1 hypothetical protein SAMN04488066_101367 [Halorubrum aquaticum]